jgi:hypothetical protein
MVTVGANGCEEFAQNFFGGNQGGIAPVRIASRLLPLIPSHKYGQPEKRVSENPLHLFGVP